MKESSAGATVQRCPLIPSNSRRAENAFDLRRRKLALPIGKPTLILLSSPFTLIQRRAPTKPNLFDKFLPKKQMKASVSCGGNSQNITSNLCLTVWKNSAARFAPTPAHQNGRGQGFVAACARSASRAGCLLVGIAIRRRAGDYYFFSTSK